MPATVIWGKELRVIETSLDDGGTERQVVGTEGGYDFLSWSSVSDMENLAQAYGVPKASWPIYRECENEWEIPLADVRARSEALRAAVESIPSHVIENDHWLSFFVRILREGHSFFIMV